MTPAKKTVTCSCGKIFRSPQTLWRHYLLAPEDGEPSSARSAMPAPCWRGGQMTPMLRANRAVHGIGVDACEMRERLAPHRDCVQCRTVEDAIVDAVEDARREMLLPCAACAARGEIVTRRMNSEPGECPHGYGFDTCTQCHEAYHAGRVAVLERKRVKRGRI